MKPENPCFIYQQKKNIGENLKMMKKKKNIQTPIKVELFPSKGKEKLLLQL